MTKQEEIFMMWKQMSLNVFQHMTSPSVLARTAFLREFKNKFHLNLNTSLNLDVIIILFKLFQRKAYVSSEVPFVPTVQHI
jgi:hypothetical protein